MSAEQTINDANYFFAKISGYKPVNEQAGATDITYYGYLNRKGEWYIMKEDLSDGGAGVITYEFAKGSSLYSTNWTNRTGLTYVAFDAAFG